MIYSIIYYSDQVQEDVLALPDTLQARYIGLTARMIEHGPNLGLPHTDALGGAIRAQVKRRRGYRSGDVLLDDRTADSGSACIREKDTKNAAKRIKNCKATHEGV